MGANDDIDVDIEGLDFVARWEGCILHPYLDIAHKWTLGVGHLMLATDSFSCLSNAEVRELLRSADRSHPLAARALPKTEVLDILHRDAQACVRALRAGIQVPLNQYQANALVSLAFNCGTGVLSNSGVARAINAGRWADVRDAFLAWDKCVIGGVKQVNAGLHARRVSEYALFSRRPEDPPPTLSVEEQKLIDAQLSVSAKSLVSYAVLACSDHPDDAEVEDPSALVCV